MNLHKVAVSSAFNMQGNEDVNVVGTNLVDSDKLNDESLGHDWNEGEYEKDIIFVEKHEKKMDKEMYT